MLEKPLPILHVLRICSKLDHGPSKLTEALPQWIGPLAAKENGLVNLVE